MVDAVIIGVILHAANHFSVHLAQVPCRILCSDHLQKRCSICCMMDNTIVSSDPLRHTRVIYISVVGNIARLGQWKLRAEATGQQVFLIGLQLALIPS
jgi:hypothetical protein